MNIIKRDGTIETFDIEKIKLAVSKAYNSVGKTLSEEEWININSYLDLHLTDNISVEEIQDKIEKALMFRWEADVAKSYIIYREKRNQTRKFIEDRTNYINKCSISNNNTATLSEVDENANVQNKNVATIEAETYKSFNKSIQRSMMKDKLNHLFPEVAKQYEIDLENHIIYTHDESSSPIPKPYCVAVSLYPFLLNGTSTLDGLKTQAPSNLNSFCGQFNNLVFLLSSQFKGAIAFGEFFNVFYYYCVKEWGEKFWLIENEIQNPLSLKQKTISQTIEQAFQNIVYTINQPAGNRSYQSPFTNISYYDKNYWTALFEHFYYPDETQPVWEGIDHLQRKFMKWFNNERKTTLLTFPVESMALLSDGNQIIDKEYEDFTSEMYANGHSFFTYISDNPNGLASCCRLRNEIENNEFSFTGGLTGVATGSVNVITLNINRIIQDWTKTFIHPDDWCLQEVKGFNNEEWFEESFGKYLTDILQRVYKYQIAYKELLYDLYNNNMLPVYSAGYIDLKQQFSTIGINGFNEAAMFLGIKCNDNEEYNDFCKFITGIIGEQNKLHREKRIKFNLEYVPAEGLGVKNYNWDKTDGYWVPKDENCYNSYFYRPHDTSLNVLDKFKLHGKSYTEVLDGGVGCHINLEEHLSKEQYKYLLNLAIKEGTSYFTFNIPNTQCNDCGYIEKIPLKECPKCNSNNITQWTRIIGYLRPISAFSEARQIEADKRIYHDSKF